MIYMLVSSGELQFRSPRWHESPLRDRKTHTNIYIHICKTTLTHTQKYDLDLSL